MSDTLTITVHYHKKDLDAIYFPNAEHHLFKSPAVRAGLVILSLGILLVYFSTSSHTNDESNSPSGIVMGSLIIIFAVIFTAYQVYQLLRFRKYYLRFLRPLYNTSETIICSPQSFTVYDSNQSYVARWKQLNQLKINDQYLGLYFDNENHTIPSASMKPEEYAALTQYVQKQFKKLDEQVPTRRKRKLRPI